MSILVKFAKILALGCILLQLVPSSLQLEKLEHGNNVVKPSRLSALVLLDSPRYYYDLNVDCVASTNLSVSNVKCGCSEFICLINYKFTKLRNIQNCHEVCCNKRRNIKSVVV